MSIKQEIEIGVDPETAVREHTIIGSAKAEDSAVSETGVERLLRMRSAERDLNSMLRRD